MRVIFHIGMGKTGTTSIQNFLRDRNSELRDQAAEYIGMWFDLIDPHFKGLAGQSGFFKVPPAQQPAMAAQFVDALTKRSKHRGTETFIHSNESIFERPGELKEFFGALRAIVDVQLIAYMRDPHQWLPSAYSQWGIRHKTNEGPIMPFAEKSRGLIHQYDAIRGWVDNFGDILTVRHHDKGLDVVADFLEQCGLVRPSAHARHLERSEPAELLLRAMFNNRIFDQVLPEHFNKVVMNADRGVGSSQEIAERCFHLKDLSEIIEEQRPLFQFIEDRLGLKFLKDTSVEQQLPDPAALQARLIDHLIEANFQQAESLRRLERSVAELKSLIAVPPA